MKHVALLFLFFLFLNSCAVKLSTQFYHSKEEIVYQTRVLYFPHGNNKLLLNYSGILAIVNDQLVFQVLHASELAPAIASFSINKLDIKSTKYVASRKGKSLLIFIDTQATTYIFESFDTNEIQFQLSQFLMKKEPLGNF